MPESKRAVLWSAVSTRAQTEDDRDSLPAQERAARLLAEQFNWQVIDSLSVPGHSRHYTQVYECAADMRAAGIDALDRLIAHWKARDFDVLICRDGDRFARTQAMHAAVVEEIIASGAQIYSIADGIIDDKNFRMWIAMNGYKAASEIDSLRKKREMGLEHRFHVRQLPTKLPVSHRLVRDSASGKVIGAELNPDYALLWQDVATLLLEGVPWTRLEEALYERFGQVNPATGQPFAKTVMHSTVHSPSFWGHVARNHTRLGEGTKHTRRKKDGQHWVYDDTVPPPAKVELIRDVLPAVWTGELRERVIDELRRRSQQKGRAYSRDSHRFSGLCLCATCTHTMNTHMSKPSHTRYLRCPKPDCTNRQMIRFDAIQAYVHPLLETLLEYGNPAAVFDVDAVSVDNVSALEAKIESLNTQIERTMQEQSLAGEALKAHYRVFLARLSDELDGIQKRLNEARRSQAHAQATYHTTLLALDDLRAIGLDDFWQQPETAINQLLFRIFGSKRMVVLDAKIIRIADAIRQRHF